MANEDVGHEVERSGALAPLGIGLIGCGSVVANMHLNGWTRFPEKARLLAVYDVDPDRADRVATLFQEAYEARAFEFASQAARTAFWSADHAAEERLLRRAAVARQAAEKPTVLTDLDRLLADPRVEAVVVATPHPLHAPIAARALAAGKHVFSEGPMAVNLEQADQVLAAQRAVGKVYTAQYYSRYFRGSRQARRLVAAGGLGPILMARGDALWYRPQSYFTRDNWHGRRASGDRVYVHHGRYAMDLYLWVMNDPVVEVYAYAGTRTHQIEVEDNAAAQIRFRSGAFGQMMLSTSAHPPGEPRDVERIELLGERASLAGVLNYQTEDCDLTVGSRDREYAAELRRAIADEPPMPADGATTHYEAFVDAVRGGPPMLTSPESTRAQVELARAIARSLAERRPVSLPLRSTDPFYGPVDGYDS
jgi:predicted dehydrogenase